MRLWRPWQKATAVAANFPQLASLARKCTRDHEHIVLQGASPSGVNWTEVASPYWPAYAAEWVRLCAPLKPTGDGYRPGTSHLSGFVAERHSMSMEQVLNAKEFQPSGKRSVS